MACYRTKQLILFDIDGTLIHPGAIARELLDSMVEETTGVSPMLKVEDVAGFTDPIILETALRRTNFSDGALSSMVDTLLEQYPARLEEAYLYHTEAFVYNDAVELARTINEEEGWQVGLLSGNIRRAAEIKLKRFGLWEMFQFGLFGDDARNREDLVWMAAEESLEVLGESYTHDRMVLVGDTVQDVKAAKANGVRSLIVCRRSKTKNRIQSVGPTWLVDSLEETERIMTWLKAE
ncbi:MAG: HAD hydrolase-like protein [Candidatus Neomarinimicrobiota bacterium]|nr:HAD hydrolase-like protein [Candidatus Neomarinimicrobiota bacterium]